MAIFSRLFRLCKADLHGVMDQLEDKGLLLKQYLREMDESLVQKASRQAQLHDACHKIQCELDRRRTESEKIEKDLELALRKGKDEIAKMLIRKRRSLQMTSDQLERQLQVLEEENTRVAETLSAQRMRYDQLKVKAGAYRHLADQQRFEMNAPVVEGPGLWQAPTDDEIELELLQRKEALVQGGAP
jgi:phage shock protein A